MDWNDFTIGALYGIGTIVLSVYAFKRGTKYGVEKTLDKASEMVSKIIRDTSGRDARTITEADYAWMQKHATECENPGCAVDELAAAVKDRVDQGAEFPLVMVSVPDDQKRAEARGFDAPGMYL